MGKGRGGFVNAFCKLASSSVCRSSIERKGKRAMASEEATVGEGGSAGSVLLELLNAAKLV